MKWAFLYEQDKKKRQNEKIKLKDKNVMTKSDENKTDEKMA